MAGKPGLEAPSGSLRVLELFAGIGGWRLALTAALPEGTAAEFSPFDSGPHCSEIYLQNFREPCCRRNIEQLGAKDLEGFDVWAMSPPCQPFSTTREAKQKGLEDARCKALDHLCKMVPLLERPPKWIVLENVKGFHGSDACVKWRAALAASGYTDRELLLDLAHFGAPNHRTRYYLLAERSSRFAGEAGEAEAGAGAAELLPAGVLCRGPWAWARRLEAEAAHLAARRAASRSEKEAAFQGLRELFCSELAAAGAASVVGADGRLAETPGWKLLPLPRAEPDAVLVAFDDGRAPARALLAEVSGAGVPGAEWSWAEGPAGTARPIGDYLEEEAGGASAEAGDDPWLPREVLQKGFAKGLSYVTPGDQQSFCFTGHYGKVLHKSSGSLLCLPAGGSEDFDKSDPTALHGRVRFFSPKEILNILGFPRDFRMPGGEMDIKHRYKAVGNSIAVTVASELCRVLLLGEEGAPESAERLRLNATRPAPAACPQQDAAAA